MTATGNGYCIWALDRLANMVAVARAFHFKIVQGIPPKGPLRDDPTPGPGIVPVTSGGAGGR
jgi:hypothetical protein